MDIDNLVIQSNQVLRKALEKLNWSGLGIVFILDENKTLIGVLTDGIIRRSLLANNDLDTVVMDVMNRNFISLPVDTDNSVILSAINDNVKIIPLVDKQNRLVDYASINKIRRISIASPLLNGNELAYVTDCIKTNWISSQGKYVKQFENLFSQYHNEYTALAVSSGTVALHLALKALNIGDSDEVIVPDLTFAASLNAIIYTGATPVLVDVEKDTWNMDVKKIEALITTKTKAIMPVHLYGNPCNMDAIMEISKKYNLLVVEDCAEALGSYYKDQPVGIFGDAATFSFYGNKTITTGEGGMVVFKNAKTAERATILRDHGMSKTKRYWHEEVGYNYRLTNIQAAIGVAQFERLDEFVKVKRNIAKVYNDALSETEYFQMPIEKAGTINSYWLYTCLVKPNAPFEKNELIAYLKNHGIESRPVFYPMHIMPPYINYGKSNNLKISQLISRSGISLPSSVNLSEIELDYICKTILQFIKSTKTNH